MRKVVLVYQLPSVWNIGTNGLKHTRNAKLNQSELCILEANSLVAVRQNSGFKHCAQCFIRDRPVGAEVRGNPTYLKLMGKRRG